MVANWQAGTGVMWEHLSAQLSSALDFGGPESQFSQLVCVLSAQVHILPGDMLAQT